MIDTPIVDFVNKYAQNGALRLHMPGHKGADFLGFERFDITEIEGADSLYEADGIIKKSEDNASSLFGCPTFYSTEGSSHCIRAMLSLVKMFSGEERPLVLAGRNAHKVFLSACALLDIEVDWLTGKGSYLSCDIDKHELDLRIGKMTKKPSAVYITSPDYLGNIADIKAIADVCHKHGALLIVDNAHGAYLRFLYESKHPIDLGADMCCDSAHKTLPVLTGGAYLHISSKLSQEYVLQAKNALAMFGSTSPSYIILQSLDMANKYLSSDYGQELAKTAQDCMELKAELEGKGFVLTGDEAIKITVLSKPYGYTGRELADMLLQKNIVCEFSDPDHLVMMITPQTGREGMEKLKNALLSIEKKAPISVSAPSFALPERKMSIRKAAFSVSETIKAKDSIGRVLASATVGCPPAVPIVVSGEVIDENAVKCFEYYGIDTCTVIKE